ncbi:hypothetical protein B0H12DRAFT_1138440, partial [Mycena haematopus]
MASDACQSVGLLSQLVHTGIACSKHASVLPLPRQTEAVHGPPMFSARPLETRPVDKGDAPRGTEDVGVHLVTRDDEIGSNVFTCINPQNELPLHDQVIQRRNYVIRPRTPLSRYDHMVCKGI